MNIVPVKTINLDSVIVDNIEEITQSTLRLITYSRKHLADDLLNQYLSKITTYKQLLSVKNAQMEAQSEKEAKQYAQWLNQALDFITNEIKENNNFSSEVQLFQLFRIIAPDSHAMHPNKYRTQLVQIGKYLCPEPNIVPRLVSELFYQMEHITNPIIRAIYFHHELIRIHPFSDGNGRTTRMAKNWMLMYNLYSPIFISDEKEKNEYVRTLEGSFLALNHAPNKWNEFLDAFFQQELERLQKNTVAVYNFVKDKGQDRFISGITK